MSVRLRLGARLSAAVVVTAIPMAMGGLAPTFVPVSQSVDQTVDRTVDRPSDRPTGEVSVAPITPSVTSMQRHYLARVPDSMRPQVVAPQVTFTAALALTTRAERHRKIAVSSSKGSLVVTASSLAEHDLPSAAMRAYKHAARSIDSTDPGCHLDWTLLAGVGRVESDHGRYGGSVLGVDGVPRPAIVGIALDGKGPVAAIHDTDHGTFDGDPVWDRAVGPMQFIPSTWRYAGRDGDHDGIKSPNDIDDAALAAAAYLCRAGGDLSSESARRTAIFGYNASDYYVDLVSAFARGYRTGVFVIPSPPVAPGSGDGVVHLQAKRADHPAVPKKAKKAKKVEKVKKVKTVTVEHPPTKHPVAAPQPTGPAPTKPAPAAPKPKPKPKPPAPKPVTLVGTITAVGNGFAVSGRSFAASDVDWQVQVDGVDDDLQALVDRHATVTVVYTPGKTGIALVAVKDLDPLPPAPSASPSASQSAAPEAS